jgi:methionyl-tRNA synthetase
MPSSRFYLTTPIYYVNGEPHIGHIYTTVVADTIARTHRIRGDDVLLITGTDEHATKVVDSAAERGLTAKQWADQNAEVFRATFARLQIEHDDFIRTSEDRHKRFVESAIRDLMQSGDIYLGEFEGWYDASQEDYVPETRAAEHDYKSPITGQPLIRRREENYFFRLSAYQDRLLKLFEEQPDFVQPKERRNEVAARVREGLNDVPVSRRASHPWGVRFPGTTDHVVYVWIDALLSYLTVVASEERRPYWPARVHLIGKEILWFHAAIWPAMLLALRKQPHNSWLQLPSSVYAHSFWISDGQKMSKTLGNFIDLPRIDQFIEQFGLDALRYFLVTQGPIGTIDSDWSSARFTDVYNSDLANTVGNCWSRIAQMVHRYLGGRLPRRSERSPLRERVEQLAADPGGPAMLPLGLRDIQSGLQMIAEIDRYIEATQPFKLARDAAQQERVAEILYECAEAFRIASLWLWPALPEKMQDLWQRMGLDYGRALAQHGRGRRSEWSRWGGLPQGAALQRGEPLFPRFESK